MLTTAPLTDRRSAAVELDHFQSLERAYLESLVAQRAACTRRAEVDAIDRRTARETELLDRPRLAVAKLARHITDAIESRVTAFLHSDGEIDCLDPTQLVFDITDAPDALAWEFDERVTVHVPATKKKTYSDRRLADGDDGLTATVAAWITAVKVVDGRCIVVVEVGEED